MGLRKNIKTATRIEIMNQSQNDMIKRFGFFVAYFLFWNKKYDNWYQKRIKYYQQKLGERNEN